MKKLGATLSYPSLKQCRNKFEEGSEVSQQNQEKFEREENKTNVSKISDAELDCAIRSGAFSGFHPVGTLKMGSENDSESVLDTNLK